MGDSSGGGFALVFAQSMREIITDDAKQIILLSPWLNIDKNDISILSTQPQPLNYIDIHYINSSHVESVVLMSRMEK